MSEFLPGSSEEYAETADTRLRSRSRAMEVCGKDAVFSLERRYPAMTRSEMRVPSYGERIRNYLRHPDNIRNIAAFTFPIMLALVVSSMSPQERGGKRF